MQTLKSIKNNFVSELQDAYAGKKTSLPFIIHKISKNPIVKDSETFHVLVIGGTVAKVAALRKNGERINILGKQDDQVNFQTEEDFLSFAESKIKQNINVLALNFAYPMTPIFENGRLDGILLSATKEGKFKGLVGRKIGKDIEDYVLKKRNKKITVSVANDTVCLLLSGLTRYKLLSLAAGIVGTGLNFALFLDSERLVNLESANFDKFPQSMEGKIIDRESDRPGKSLFEKETAGAYLYKHFNLIIKQRKIDHPPINSTEELNELCHPEFISEAVLSSIQESKNRSLNKFGMTKKQVQHDMVEVSKIAQDLLRRSAQLIACQIAGITEFKQRSMIFNMEGSLFWKANGYKETVEQTVKQLVPQYNVEFVEIKDSGILGAAKLVS
ncbi:MAG: hypothetical protein AAB583_03500 [Patescibacteria group bacterium]